MHNISYCFAVPKATSNLPSNSANTEKKSSPEDNKQPQDTIIAPIRSTPAFQIQERFRIQNISTIDESHINQKDRKHENAPEFEIQPIWSGFELVQ